MMEAEDAYINEVEQLYKQYNPSKKCIKELEIFLRKEFTKNIEQFLVFLQVLNKSPIIMINIRVWKKQLRLLRRISKAINNIDCQYLLMKYIIQATKIYFPYPLTNNNIHKFKQILDIVKGFRMEIPKNYNDQRQIIFYLQNKYNQEWEQGLVEIINSQVLIDKKQAIPRQNFINELFSPIVAKNFQKILPQLQRLLVRSATNIQILVQFFQKCKNVKNIDEYILSLFKIIKNMFLTYPQQCISLVNTLTSNITNIQQFKSIFQYLSNLINTQHQAKKRIIYIQMLQGLINSLKYFQDPQFSNSLMILLSGSFGKFVEEDQFKIIINLLNKILPMIKQPNQGIAISFKPYLKSTNKYVLIYIGLTLANLYRQKHINQIPGVRVIYDHYKAQLNAILKNLNASWQWAIPIISFLGRLDPTYLEQIHDQLPIFKPTCLSLQLIQRKFLIDLYIQLIDLALSRQEDVQQHILLCLGLVLEETKDRSCYQKLKTIPIEIRLNLLSKVIYPCLWYKSKITKANSRYSFASLARYILSSIQDKIPANSEHLYRIIAISQYLSIRIKIINDIPIQVSEDTLKLALYNYSSDQKYFPNTRRVLILELAASKCLEINCPQYFYQSLEFLLNHQKYQKDLNALQLFRQQLQGRINQNNKNLQKQKSLIQQFLIQQKLVIKKVFAQDLSIKMMSQNQVKLQKYRIHFIQMHYYYQKLLTLMLSTKQTYPILSKLWSRKFSALVQIATYSQHRMVLYKLIRRTCEQFYKKFKLINVQGSKILQKYSTFIAQFFISKGAKLTPSVSLMQKCQKFLNNILSFPFQNFNQQFILLFLNQICQYILKDMEFDISLKKNSVQFYYKCINKKLQCFDPAKIYTLLVANINILSSCPQVKSLLSFCTQKIDPKRYSQLFQEILSFVSSTKKLILEVILSVKNYKPQFEDYIKLRILALQQSSEIQNLAQSILKNDHSHAKSIINFNMVNFMRKNSKQTIQKLCQFIKQCLTQQLVGPIFQMVIITSKQLYDDQFDQQGLEFFPYFLTLNIDFIRQPFLRPVFDLLITKYSANPQHATLSRLSLDIGIQIIKQYAPKYSNQLLQIFQSYINKSKGVSNIIFLGVLAPHLKNNNDKFLLVQKRITQLFSGDHQAQQRAISKCMPDLMSFFKQPLKKIQQIFESIQNLNEKLQIGQSYLFVGLLKGIGSKQTFIYLDKLLAQDYPCKTKSQKNARLLILLAFVQNFGRAIQNRAMRIVQIVINCNADSIPEVRDLARKVGQILVVRLSSYSVKKLLPKLLEGLENQQNWRIKISYIWILGIMANSSAKQLQTSLPVIVPTLSACLSNAHPTIRDKASQALSLIGQTIKNPQISQSIDILIQALQNPFEKSSRALEILLKTRFSHYIDPPSLSIIIPIVDYSLRGRNSQLKAGACQVIGSICQLIQNQYDLLPYLRMITGGLKVALCDPLSQIRSIAAMAIGLISNKIGAKSAQQYFRFVQDIIQSAQSNTTQKQGAAQAYSQIICSQDQQYFQQSLNKIFQKLSGLKTSQKQGFILIFLYVPNIRKQQFEGFIKQVNQNMYHFVSDQDQNIRNSAMLVQKVLITNYCISHTDLLLQPLCQGVFEQNWRKRNAALILIGQMLNIIKSYMYNNRTSDKNYAYYQALMAVYILKDDQLQMPRMTANQVWNAYIENTPKTIKLGLKQLVKMWTRFTHAANGVVFRNIVAFSSKYGQNYFYDILEHLEEFLEDQVHKKGVFEVLSQFIKRLTQQFLSKQNYRTLIRAFFSKYIFSARQQVRESLARSMALYVQKMHEQVYFQDLLYPQIDRMDAETQSSESYLYILHLLKDFLHTSSKIVVQKLIRKILLPPLSDFKIEVITNNADKIANYLYSYYKVPATNILLDQIYSLANSVEKQGRVKLLVYCLQQVSTNLSPNYKTQFIGSLTKKISDLTNDLKNGDHSVTNALEIILEMVLFFLNATPLEQVDQLQTLIGQISLLISQKGRIVELTHKIFLILVSDPKASKTPMYYKQLLVSLENNLQGKIIWENQDIAQDYISVLVKGIAYGNSIVMDQSIKMIEFMLVNTNRTIIQGQILRIVGPIIRVTNYPLTSLQKLNLIDFIHKIYLLGFDIEVYYHQILSVCFRLLQEIKNNSDTPQIISVCFIDLLTKSTNKQQIINSILKKYKFCNENVIKSIYYLIKQVIKDSNDLLSKGIFQNIRNQINIIFNDTQIKKSTKSIYYISKTIARIGVHLGHPYKKYELQLQGVTCSYEKLLHFLHFSYYSKMELKKLGRLQIFLKQSSRDKLHYLLKSIKLCRKINEATKSLYSLAYINSLIPQGLSGFQEIVDILESFQ